MKKLGRLRTRLAVVGLAAIISFSSLGCCFNVVAEGSYAIPDYCRKGYKEAVEKAQSTYYIKYKGENFCRTRDRWKIHRQIGTKVSVLYILKKGEQREIVSLDEIREAYPGAKELKNGIFDF